MEIAISEADEKFINQQVSAGHFPDPRTVISRALEALRETRIPNTSDSDALRKAIAAGIDDLDNGRSDVWDADQIKAEGRRLLAARKAK